MTSDIKRAGERRREDVLAAARGKRGVPWLVIGVGLVLEPLPHGVHIKADFIWAEEPKGLAAIGQDHEFGCPTWDTSGLCDAREA